jgi:erythromycin esterase-like protein
MDATITRPRAVELRQAAYPLAGDAGDLDPLLALVGGARFVLLGEASHGTHEFYRVRAEVPETYPTAL